MTLLYHSQLLQNHSHPMERHHTYIICMYNIYIQPCTALYHHVLCTLYYPVLLCTTLYYSVLPCTTLYRHVRTMYHVLPCTTLYYTAPHCTTLHHTVLHCTTLYYPVLPCTLMYYPDHIVPHCTTLYCSTYTANVLFNVLWKIEEESVPLEHTQSISNSVRFLTI